MRKAFDVILTINLLILLAATVYLWWIGRIVIEFKSGVEVAEEQANPYENLAFIFSETLKNQVRQDIGTPTEGYTPDMVLAAFPGLAITDFEGVEASVGSYVIENGALVHTIPRGTLSHSAAGALPKRGFETLLQNAAERLQINLNHSGTLTQLMEAISK